MFRKFNIFYTNSNCLVGILTFYVIYAKPVRVLLDQTFWRWKISQRIYWPIEWCNHLYASIAYIHHWPIEWCNHLYASITYIHWPIEWCNNLYISIAFDGFLIGPTAPVTSQQNSNIKLFMCDKLCYLYFWKRGVVLIWKFMSENSKHYLDSLLFQIISAFSLTFFKISSGILNPTITKVSISNKFFCSSTIELYQLLSRSSQLWRWCFNKLVWRF